MPLVPMDHGLALGPPVECPTEVARDPWRDPNVGAIAFSRSGDPNLGAFKDAVILKTFGEVPTISNGNDAHVRRRRGE
jgi:hypothetical protein